MGGYKRMKVLGIALGERGSGDACGRTNAGTSAAKMPRSAHQEYILSTYKASPSRPCGSAGATRAFGSRMGDEVTIMAFISRSGGEISTSGIGGTKEQVVWTRRSH